MNPESGRLATKLSTELAGSRLRFFPDSQASGRLAVGTDSHPSGVYAECRFVFREDWRNRPPKLWCDEKWIRRPGGVKTTDWHIFPDGSLCYVLVPEWIDTIASIEERYGSDAAYAAAAHYVLGNSRWLLYHHLLGYRNKLADWPKEWPGYPHGIDAALKVYHKGRLLRRP